MAKQTINLGSDELAGDGESLRSAFSKTNENFDEVYALSQANDLSNLSQDIIPAENEVYDLGSPTRRFKDLHLSGNTIFLGAGQISIGEDGAVEFSGDARQVELTQQDIVGDVFSEDSTLIINGRTGHVLNLGGEDPDYYLDYDNFINAPIFDFNEIANKPGIDEILEEGNTTSRALTVGSLQVGQIIGNGSDSITNIFNITSQAGDLNSFLNIAGSGGGNISGYSNLVGGSNGEIIGFTNITSTVKMTINGTEWNDTDVNNWNTAYSWGDHGEEGYATISYVDDEVAAAVIGSGFVDTAYINLVINQLKNNAPITLDTLGEIASAINNDPQYYQTVNTALNTKLNIADFDSTFNSALAGTDTDALEEGTTNLYYTDSKVATYIASRSTDDLSEGATNLYYTDARVDTNFAAKDTDALSEGATNLYYTEDRVNALITTNNLVSQNYVDTAISNLVDSSPETLDTLNELAAALGDDPNFATTITDQLALKLNTADFASNFDSNLALSDTDDLTEGSTNLFFTDTRSRNAISGEGDITVNNTTGVISFNNASGYLNFDNVTISTDTWTALDDTEVPTVASVEQRILEETFDTINLRGGATSISTDAIAPTTPDGAIDFSNNEIENVVIDFGSYSG